MALQDGHFSFARRNPFFELPLVRAPHPSHHTGYDMSFLLVGNDHVAGAIEDDVVGLVGAGFGGGQIIGHVAA